MLLLLGHILDNAGSAIRSIVCDNHSSHKLIKQALLGQYAARPHVPFFGSLEYESLPMTCIPNLSFRVALIDGEPIYLLGGPNHLQKNCASAMRALPA